MTDVTNDQFTKSNSEDEEKEPLQIKSDLLLEVNDNKSLSLIEQIKCIRSNITVEPVIACFVISGMISMLAVTNLNLDKACRVNLNYSAEICRALSLRQGNHTTEEEEIHKLVATVQIWRGAVNTALPALLLLFVGAWSDKKGKRKILMALPICGEIITHLLNIVSTFFFNEISIQWTVVLETICTSLTGGLFTVCVASFSYISDITTVQTRTYRLSILSMCMTIGFPVGISLSSILLKELGFYGIFVVAGTVQLLNLMYVLCFLEDHTWLNNETKIENKNCLQSFLEFFDLKSIKETFGVVFQIGPKQRRVRICLILLAGCLCAAQWWSEPSVLFLYFRLKFNWNDMQYSMYFTYNFIAQSLGSILTIKYLIKTLKLDDSVLGIVSTISHIISSLVLVFANKEIYIYAIPILDILGGVLPVALKSIATTLVTQQEVGKIFSLFAMIDLLMPIIFVPIYNKLYILVVNTPGATFLISVALSSSVLLIFSWFNVQHKRDRKNKRSNIEMSDLPLPGY